MRDRRAFLKHLSLFGGASVAVPALLAEPVDPDASVKTRAAQPAHRGAVRDALEFITVTDVEYFTLEFPNATPLTWNAIRRSGGRKPRVNVLELHTDAGIKGAVIPKGPEDLVRSYANKIKGVNLLHVERVWDHMYYYNRKPVAKGEAIHAIGSVDLAVWDIVGKALDLPVHRLLGTYREEIPVYAAGGYYAENKGIPELVAEMERYAALGFKVAKMKVGGLPVHEDAERVRAVCNALGRDCRVMVDANNGYRSAYEAIRFGRLVEDLDLYWFEEPVAPDDWRGNAEVREELDIPVTAGENEFTRWGARDLIENHSCDILNLDPIKAGGLTEYRKIAALASAYHMPVSPHGTGHMNIHLMASLPNALIMETYPERARDFNPALPPMPLNDGMVSAPTEPGLGMDIDPKLIEQYRIS